MFRGLIVVLTAIHVVPLVAEPAKTSAKRAPLRFERDVRPIFKVACFHCHGEHGEKKGKLDVRLVRLMLEGGRSGASIVAGDADASELWQRIASDEMPKGAKKLSPEEKAIVRRWIEQGARTARPEPEDPDDARFTIEELEHWAFQPLPASLEVPAPEGYPISTPVDAFIARRLAEENLAFSPAAGRPTLLRRLTFDLTGLPPTPREIAAFVNDTSPDAYERAVDRLLTSTQFGVRWGRHWLDVAGFAETHGSSEADPKRPHAWRYRDYVIDSINEGKRIDVFLVEQLAGDEIAKERSTDLRVQDPETFELLTATGFLRMAPDATQTTNTLTERNSAAAAAIQVVSSSVLGLTVGCAQCHDHKYDPIGIDDYYRFRAIFDPVFPLQKWKTPGSRLIDATPVEVVRERERIEAEAKKLEAEWQARRLEVGKRIQKLKLADVPAELRATVLEAAELPRDKLSVEQKRLTELYPMVKSASFIAGFLVEYDGAEYQRFESERKKFDSLRASKPPLRLVMATTEDPGVVPESRIFFRGNPESPQEKVGPAELAVLRRSAPPVELPEARDAKRSSGRRLAYARHLTGGDHPLTARVFVNRVWHHLLGRGLVATPSDFGISGARPSHPRLLDWLAREFVTNGWDLKRLVRTIVLSTTYRQSSLRSPALDAVDPENNLLARSNLRRLEAEAIRDAILSVTGKLEVTLGGPSLPVSENNEGKAVLSAGGGETRRSVFVEVQRRLPLNMLQTFDQPEMLPNCDARRHTTVATQALWFLNDQEAVLQADALTKRVCAESDSLDGQIDALFVLLFAERPTEAERERCRTFVASQTKALRSDKDPGFRALSSLSQVLLASNRFLYLD